MISISIRALKPLKAKKKKTSVSGDSSNLGCDGFFLSKIAFLEGFFLVLAAKSMSLFSPFLFSKN